MVSQPQLLVLPTTIGDIPPPHVSHYSYPYIAASAQHASFPAATEKGNYLCTAFLVSRNGRLHIEIRRAGANVNVDGEVVGAPRHDDVVNNELVATNGMKNHQLLPRLRQNIWESISNRNNISYSSLDITPPSAPAPPFTGGLISLLGLVLVLGVIFDRWIIRGSRGIGNTNQEKAASQLKAPTGVSVFLEKDLRKESVEWVNMVIGKLWKVYRVGLEDWIIRLLQPLIDNLQRPSYVKGVEIKQFYLGDEPISVTSVKRRASRRINNLQYHINLRYTGGARILLYLKLKVGFIPIIVPVVVRGLDVDGEVWVKLGLVPSGPWVGAATWAFVSLPSIKLELSLFRLFNLMAIPFLSVFLIKLLTEDLPQLFVRPNKNVINFLKGGAGASVPKDFNDAALDRFSGELSVTLVEARKLNRVPYGKTDPYVVLSLGDQVIKSKRNTQTSVIGPPGSPIWNQDFQLLVLDSKTQRLGVQVRDYFGLSTVTVGVGEVDLSALQDTVPVDILVKLMTVGWAGLFGRKHCAGEVLLRLTYTAYVEDEEDEAMYLNGYMSETDEISDTVPSLNELANKFIELIGRDSNLTDMFQAVIAELNNEDSEFKYRSRIISEDNEILGSKSTTNEGNKNLASNNASTADGSTTLIWLGLVTGLVILVDISLNFSNLLNP